MHFVLQKEMIKNCVIRLECNELHTNKVKNNCNFILWARIDESNIYARPKYKNNFYNSSEKYIGLNKPIIASLETNPNNSLEMVCKIHKAKSI